MKQELTAARLRELLHYDPETGVFTWRVNTSNVKAGAIANSVHTNGYIRFGVDGAKRYAHRLAWLYVHGEMPAHQIDHINGNRRDNRITNLRDVTRGVNMENQRRARSNNMSSGLLGVSWNKAACKWSASIMVARRNLYLGLYSEKGDAYAAYLKAKREMHQGCAI